MSTAVRHSNIKVHDEDNVIYIPAPSSACVQVLNGQLVCGGETGGEDLNLCGPGNTDIHVPQLYDIQPWCSCNAIQYRHVMLIPCAFLAFIKCGSHTKKYPSMYMYTNVCLSVKGLTCFCDWSLDIRSLRVKTCSGGSAKLNVTTRTIFCCWFNFIIDIIAVCRERNLDNVTPYGQ